jgi:hypothetical protein
VLIRLSTLSDVPFDVETQEFWRQHPRFKPTLDSIILNRSFFASRLSPETQKLGLRAPCPTCGLAKKHGLTNRYTQSQKIVFTCPHHGEFEIDLDSPDQIRRLEMNTPLRNLIRVLICSEDERTSWILCTGGDYAGFYQEQLLYRLVEQKPEFPVIFYAPLILDWSGSKLSKSLYVKEGAYRYLVEAGLAYMLDVRILLNAESGCEALYEEVSSWVREPYKLFRSYSLEYLHRALVSRGMVLDSLSNRK